MCANGGLAVATITLESRPGSIEIEFQLTWAQKRAAATALARTMRQRLGLNRHRLWLASLCAALAVTALVGLWLSGASTGQLLAAAAAALAGFLLIGGSWVLTRMEQRRAGPLFSRRTVRQNWRLGPGGVDLTFGKSRMHLAWEDVRAVRPIDGMTLLFLDRAQYLIVPDTAFVSRDHRRRFLAYLKVALEVSYPRKRSLAQAA